MSNMSMLFEKNPYLETEKFILRKIDIQDYKDIYEIYSDEDVLKYQCMHPIKSLEETKKYIGRIENSYEEKKLVRLGISKKIDDKIIGLCSIYNFDYLNSKLEIGYILNKKYWRQNIMSEILKVIIDFLIRDFKIETIEAKIHPNNISSIKLCEKLGFKKIDLKKNFILNKKTNKYEDRYIYCYIKCKNV